MRVIQTIQTKATDPFGAPTDEPVEVPFYTGDSLPKAMAALAMATSDSGELAYVNVLSVRIEF